MKMLIQAIKEDYYLRKALVGAVIVAAGVGIVYSGGIESGKRFGAERAIKIAEKMQPGFQDAFIAFAKENY